MLYHGDYYVNYCRRDKKIFTVEVGNVQGDKGASLATASKECNATSAKELGNVSERGIQKQHEIESLAGG